MAKTDYFWTDIDQARQRLSGCVVNYDNEPVYIENVTRVDEDTTPRVIIYPCGVPMSGKGSRKKANSPKFDKFRSLPELGWMILNGGKMITYVLRRIVSTQIHGISASNTVCSTIYYSPDRASLIENGQRTNFSNVWPDPGFTAAQKGEYPSLAGILKNILPNTGIPFSLKYCVIQDGDGIVWLYRGLDKAGIFIGGDTLYLLHKKGFLREELMEDKLFTIDNIREM